ncbi:hypothetical protein [Pengzhenrongella sicca]|uniref:Uncharacterized protein n=1 Tax=Pengzhenrongella sicca TaxID=2819238 RepID=A0A8A4ZB43_9MICO|nr:hypothetical protein [Pengzhenrongella sicca]QTE27806.1 hypothetical protein J4E96_10230 [Pengzhenrongella sicca]
MNGWLVALVAVGALTLSVAGGWAATVVVLRLASRSGDAGPPPGPTPPASGASTTPAGGTAPTLAATGPAGAESVLRGGTWIGLLERLAITGALLAGYPAAIAFVIAIKGLGRYPELRENPAASERFVIGTLTSMVWAALAGVGGLALLGGAIIPG